MRIFIVVFFHIVFGLLHLAAQDIDDLDFMVQQSVSVHNDSVNISTEIIVEDMEVKTEDELMYYWYKTGTIHKSRGGVGGSVLHGEYAEYFNNGNLKVQGYFREGLKHGTWKRWYPDGELMYIENWRSGKLHGSTKKFNLRGEEISLTNYDQGIEVQEKESRGLRLFTRKKKK